jgi:hypothetical protein
MDPLQAQFHREIVPHHHNNNNNNNSAHLFFILQISIFGSRLISFCAFKSDSLSLNLRPSSYNPLHIGFVSVTRFDAAKACRGSGGKAPCILTSALDEGELPASHSGRFTPGQRAPWALGFGGPEIPTGRIGNGEISIPTGDRTLVIQSGALLTEISRHIITDSL